MPVAAAAKGRVCKEGVVVSWPASHPSLLGCWWAAAGEWSTVYAVLCATPLSSLLLASPPCRPQGVAPAS